MGRADSRRRFGALVSVVIALLSTSCASSGNEGDAEVRTVRVDFRHDEFASSMIGFFPRQLRVHPGDIVRFRQEWTGEPHTVTYSGAFNDELGHLMRLADSANPPPVGEEPAELAEFDALPAMLGDGDEAFVVRQNGAQPCYLDEGDPPQDGDQTCPPRPQPHFTGRHSYYSSGFITYEGTKGNTFEVPLADDIAAGTYNFYCNLHGVGQATSVTVVPKTEEIPSQRQVDRVGKAERDERYAAPLLEAFARARDGGLEIAGRRFVPPLAGGAAARVRAWEGGPHRRHLAHRHGSVNEFIPETVRVQRGERVTWTMIGRHTISFNVPRYVPIFSVSTRGVVRLNRQVHEPIGWPGRPADAPPGTADVDAGEWNGKGFRSSGLAWTTGDRFSVTVTEPGSYTMACLVHPTMVGKLVVD